MNFTPPHDLPHTVVSLPCYEPVHMRIELTGEELTRNTLLTGAIGSGKTSSLNEILYQLMGYRAEQPDRKIGLLVFDFKRDDTVARLQQWTREQGRSGDLRVIDAASPWRMELLQGFDSLARLDFTVDTLLAAGPKEDENNPYFAMARRKRLTMGLGIYRLTREGPPDGASALDFLQRLFGSEIRLTGGMVGPLPELETFRHLADALPGETPPPLRQAIRRIEAGLDEWARLDSRTRSNEQSTLSNLLAPLTNYSAYNYLFAEDKAPVDLETIVTEGKIVVLSISALVEPELAGTLGRLAKSRFYAAVQSRALGYHDPGRLAGIIMDEFPLVATGGDGRFSDIPQLQAMRSMRGFAIAAAQGFQALVRILGQVDTVALLSQFHQHFLFQSREPEVAAYARRLWGDRAVVEHFPRTTTPYFHAAFGTAHLCRIRDEPVCAPEGLAGLQPGQAFVWTETTREVPEPFWLVERHAARFPTAPSPAPAEVPPAEWETRLRRLAHSASQDPSLLPATGKPNT